MEIQSVKWFVFGLLCFALGTISLTGYFLTPSNNDKYQDDIVYSDKSYAAALGVSLMSVGFLVVLITGW